MFILLVVQWEDTKDYGFFSDAPDLFAAALIACPAKLPSLEKLHRLKNKKIWLIHSALDEIVPIENSLNFLEQIYNEKSTQAMFTLYGKVVIEGKVIDPHCVFYLFTTTN